MERLALCCWACGAAASSIAAAAPRSRPPLTTQRIALLFADDSTPQPDLQRAQCLVREAAFITQPVRTVPCASVSSDQALSAAWVWFSDGRIRGTNGFCLKYTPGKLQDPRIQSDLTASACRQGDASNEHNDVWTVNAMGRLRPSGASLVGTAAGSTIWQSMRVVKQPFDASRFKSDVRPYERVKARFRQMMRDIPDIARQTAELTAVSGQLEKEALEVEKAVKEASAVIQDIKTDMSGHPTHIGEGVAIELLESASASKPSFTFLSPKFELSEEKLRLAGVDPSGPVSIRVSGYAVAPYSGRYRFVVKDLSSQFRLSANGQVVIDQWSAPTLGSVESREDIELKELEEVQLVATTSGILGVPNFKVLWRINDRSPTEIPSNDLYPNVLEPVCTGSNLITNLKCTTTFSKLRVSESEPVKVRCPPGCLAIKPSKSGSTSSSTIPGGVFGTPKCYAMHSSVCMSAIHSGVSGERGGVFLVQLDTKKDMAKYKGVEGHLISSENAPANTGCGVIATSLTEGGPEGLESLQVIDRQALMADQETRNPMSGIHAIPTTSSKVIIGRKAHGADIWSGVSVSCGASDFPVDTHLFDKKIDIGRDASLLIKKASSSQDRPLTEVFLVSSGGTASNLKPTRYGWNRVACQTTTDTVSVYYKYPRQATEFQYPSASVECEDTFDMLRSPLEELTVRCPRQCIESLGAVIGSFTYAGSSSVCRSAIHGIHTHTQHSYLGHVSSAGVISDSGGLVEVLRLPITSKVTWKSNRNGISSAASPEDAATPATPLYALRSQSGRRCVYPEHPGGLIHLALGPRGRSSPEPTTALLDSGSGSNSFSFRQLSGSTFDLLESLKNTVGLGGKGSAARISELSEHMIHMGRDQDNLTRMIVNMEEAATLVEKSVRQKLERSEAVIANLEQQLCDAELLSTADLTDYGKSSRLSDDWLTVDALSASNGPSHWAMDATAVSGTRGIAITQHSPIALGKTPAATALVLRGKMFDRGFLAARLRPGLMAYGVFGFLVKYRDDKNYVALQLKKPLSAADPGSLSFITVNDGKASAPEGSIELTLTDGVWYKFGIDFGQETARVYVDGGQYKTGLTFSDPIQGGTVGIFTNGLSARGGEPLAFDSFVAGPLEEQENAAKGFFESQVKEDMMVKVLKPVDTSTSPVMASVTEAQPIQLHGVSDESGASNEEGVSVEYGTDKQCIRNMQDAMSGLNARYWNVPATQQTDWFPAQDEITSKYTRGSSEATRPSPVYLKQRPCQEKGMSMGVTLRVHDKSAGGLLVRGRDDTEYTAVILDSRASPMKIDLVDVTPSGGTLTKSTSSFMRLQPDAWYTIETQQQGESSSITVKLNGRVVLQTTTTTPSSVGVSRMGILLEEGTVDYRNFNIDERIV